MRQVQCRRYDSGLFSRCFNIPSSSPTDPRTELLRHSDSEYPGTRNINSIPLTEYFPFRAVAPISRVEPVLESNLEALEHLFFDVFDISELAPPSYITVFRMAINLYDKLFHQPQLVRVFSPEMLFANVSSLFLPVLSS